MATAAIAAVGIGLSVASTYFGSQANKKALQAQKKAAKLQAEYAKRRAALEERQFKESIRIADRQLVTRMFVEERQGEAQAVEDRAAVKADLDTENLNAARQAADIRKGLNSTLATQQATLSARGVASGSLRDSFDAEARSVAADDMIANEINRLTAGADAEAQFRGINTSLRNQKEGNLLTLAQTRESSSLQLAQSREATNMALRQQYELARLGVAAAAQQSAYANTAMLLQGFGQIAAIGYDYYRTSGSIEPSGRSSTPTSYRPLIRANNGMAAGV